MRIEQADLAILVPHGFFDSIVSSELGYYFPTAMLDRIVRGLENRLAPHGEIVAVHWRGWSNDHVLHGDAVHAILKERLENRCTWLNGGCFHDFRLDVWNCK